MSFKPIKTGTGTVTAAASTKAITFTSPYATGSAPKVVCTPSYQTSFWVTSVTNTGFTFNVGTTSAYDQDFHWHASL